MLRFDRVLAVVVVPALASVGAAQNVLVVDAAGGGGSFSTQIQPAIDAAAEGDIVLVRSGTYGGFTLVGKSLSIVADAGGAVSAGTCVIRSLAASQTAEVRGIQLHGSEFGVIPEFAAEPGLRLSDNAGPVWIERVDAYGGLGTVGDVFTSFSFAGGAGIRVTSSAWVTLERCSGHGGVGGDSTSASHPPTEGGAGLHATDSNVAIHDGTFAGGRGGNMTGSAPGAAGGDGATLFGGSLFAFASAARFKGGPGGSTTSPFFAAGHGGDGVRVTGSLSSLGCEFDPALGGTGPLGGGAPGVAVDTASGGSHVPLVGTPRHFEVSSPVRELQSATFHFRGIPGETACAIVSGAPSAGLYFPAFGGVILTSLASADALAFGTIAPSGALDVSVPIPDFLPSMHGGRLFFQSFSFDRSLSYVALGPASLLVLLDSAL
ncbi:MAG TPA: hypothetical protein VKE69_12725 [Planctomycetota bacterium]|nr:hypothetical protein [Planctomycetota bacterium]